MIYCPKCGGETNVRAGRETDYGHEKRRECPACGHEFKTLERRMLDPWEAKMRYVALRRSLEMFNGSLRALSVNGAGEEAEKGMEMQFAAAEKHRDALKAMMRDVRYKEVDGNMR